jgi:glycosyltransferase involved in cell wall biosynthesis
MAAQDRPKTAIVHFAAPPVVGGVEAVMAAHARAFIQAGYPVDVIAGRGSPSALPEGAGFHCIPEMDTQHPEIERISAELEQGRVPQAFEPVTLRLVESLGAALEGYPVVFFHNVFTKHFNLPLTAAVWRLIDAGAPWKPVAWCHDLSWTSAHSRPQLHDGPPWDLLRRYDPRVAYVTISQERQRDLAGMLGIPAEQIRVVYNGVDPQALYGLSGDGLRIVAEFGLLESDLVLLMPVRVTQAKNIELACRVAAALKQWDIRVRIVVTGPPDPHDPASLDYYRSLIALRERLGVQDELRFVYELDGGLKIDLETVAELYHAADVAFIPSHREGFGMPVLEAGLLGLPVFSTAIPASAELGGDAVHIFNADDDPGTVAGQIAEWAGGDLLHRMKRRVRQGFTWQAIFAKQILPLIQNANPT